MSTKFHHYAIIKHTVEYKGRPNRKARHITDVWELCNFRRLIACPGLWFFEPLESSRKKDADFSADKRRGSAEAPKPKKSDIAESLILSAVADEPKERNALIEEVQSAAREDYGADIGHTTIKNTLTRLEKAGELIRKTTGYGESKKSMFSTKNTDFGLLEE